MDVLLQIAAPLDRRCCRERGKITGGVCTYGGCEAGDCDIISPDAHRAGDDEDADDEKASAIEGAKGVVSAKAVNGTMEKLAR